MHKLFIALLVLQVVAFSLAREALAQPDAQVIVSPDGALQASIVPVARGKSVTAAESCVEIQTRNGKLLQKADYSSNDGEHGYQVQQGEWTPDSQFFVYDTASSGGHQPYRAPTFFYSRKSNSIRDIEELTNRAVLSSGPPFEVLAPHSIAIASSPDEYAKGKGFDIDHPIVLIVNLQTGAVSIQSK